MIQENRIMFNDYTIISFVVAALAIELDKITQFTHPTLHVIAVIAMLGLVFSLTLAA
jgi:hypothetical protein